MQCWCKLKSIPLPLLLLPIVKCNGFNWWWVMMGSLMLVMLVDLFGDSVKLSLPPQLRMHYVMQGSWLQFSIDNYVLYNTGKNYYNIKHMSYVDVLFLIMLHASKQNFYKLLQYQTYVICKCTFSYHAPRVQTKLLHAVWFLWTYTLCYFTTIVHLISYKFLEKNIRKSSEHDQR